MVFWDKSGHGREQCPEQYISPDTGEEQGLSGLCVKRVIWTPITLFFDNLDTQNFWSEFDDDNYS